MTTYAIHHVALSVTNRERSVAFYQKLGFQEAHFWEADDKSLTITHLKLNGFILELFCYADYQSAPDSIHATTTDLQKHCRSRYPNYAGSHWPAVFLY